MRSTIRTISVLVFVVSSIWLIADQDFEPLLTFLGSAGALIATFIKNPVKDLELGPNKDALLYPENCGNNGIELAAQKLRVSAAFGTYFTGLLERENGYTILKSQIQCAVGVLQTPLPPIQGILWAIKKARGPRLIILAGEGGMGKSTLAAKLVKCLYEQDEVDLILGDSAKTKIVDPNSGKVIVVQPGYQNIKDFYSRLAEQLGIPSFGDRGLFRDIRDKLDNRKAIIVVDNLENLERGDQLLKTLLRFTGKDIRAIVTTRNVIGISKISSKHLIVYMNPLKELKEVEQFIEWHIESYKIVHPALISLLPKINEPKIIKWVIIKSGGLPLLIQLLISDMARTSFEQLKRLPNLFGKELLDFLYRERWDDLNSLGTNGINAQKLLLWLNKKQAVSRKISSSEISRWAKSENILPQLGNILGLLQERFLIVNSDPEKGNYAVFPSLSTFLFSKDEHDE